MDLLNVKGLCKKYPEFELKDVSFNLPSGKIMGFIGRNGAGKTTTLKSIMNIIHIDKGDIKINGHSLADKADECKKEVGFVMTGIDFFPNKTIRVISKVYSKFYDNFDMNLFHRYLDYFKLNPKKKLMELSQGMKIKFLLALALSHDAKVLILDEPTSGLDPVSREEILDIFLNIIKKDNRAILFSTHITSDLDKVANQITYIRNGEIIFSDDKQEILDKYKTIKGKELNKHPNKDKIIAIKENIDGFKGLIKSGDESLFKDDENVEIRDAIIEDIIVHLEAEVNQDEEFTL